jgi:hypothetical protein
MCTMSSEIAFNDDMADAPYTPELHVVVAWLMSH